MNNNIIIISSPSGAGKTTICKYLLKKIKNLEISISHTTRPKRKTENEGVDYYFINKHRFIKLKNDKHYIETAKVFGFYYGSPFININHSFNKNKHILFDIDWQGAKTLRKYFDQSQIIDFFILPPSRKELKLRLIKRGREHLYVSAREGKLQNVVGVDIDFPEPNSPDLVIDNEEVRNDFSELVDQILSLPVVSNILE